MAIIKSIEELEARIGAPHPELQEKVIDRIDDFANAFIQRAPFIVLSTSDSGGRIDASPKGDAPGFVMVENDRSLLIPDRPGNKLAYGHRNILQNPKVGMLFIIPNTPETLRINGRAELLDDEAVLEQLAARGKPATLATRVHVEECFFHCGKAFIRSDLWRPEAWPERHKVSFGKMYAARKQLDDAVADTIDSAIETDYTDNL